MRGSPAAGKLELRAAPGGLDDLEGIAGRGGGVNDDRRRRSLPRRALVLVGPAAVVEPAVAFEELGIPVGIVVHHHQNLALEVHALEVVPLVLGRLDAVADEDHLGVAHVGGGLLHAAAGDEVVPPLQGEGLAAGLSTGLEVPGLRHLGGDADDLERLLPASVLGSRLEAERFHARRKIEPRQLVAAAGRSPALQLVVGQEADRPFEGGAVDRLGGFFGAGGEVERRLGGRFVLGADEQGWDGRQQEAAEDRQVFQVFHRTQGLPWVKVGDQIGGGDFSKNEVGLDGWSGVPFEALITPTLFSQPPPRPPGEEGEQQDGNGLG